MEEKRHCTYRSTPTVRKYYIMTSYESRKTIHHTILCLTPVIRCTDGDGAGSDGGGGGDDGSGCGGGGQRGRMRIPDSIYRTTPCRGWFSSAVFIRRRVLL